MNIWEKVKLKQAELTVFGAGNITAAVLKGLIGAGWDPKKITLCTPTEQRRAPLAHALGCRHNANYQSLDEGREQIIVLAMKPYQLADFLKNLKIASASVHCVSLIASVSIEQIHKLCPKLKITRAMPNLSASLGQSITPLFIDPSYTAFEKFAMNSMWECVGDTIVLDNEDDMHMSTAIFGSGPAICLQFLQALNALVASLGISAEYSQEFVAKLCLNSIKLLEQGDNMQDIVERITSKKGVTLAGVEAWKNQDLAAELASVFCRMRDRSKEISQEFGIE